MKYFIDCMHDSLNHYGEELCGDKVEIVRAEEGFIMVLADGLGSGVKANILATLTSKIIATMLSEGCSIDDAVSTITATLPVCSERNLAYSTFTIVNVNKDGLVMITEFDNPLCVVYRNNELYELERLKIDVFGKNIAVSQFQAQPDDLLVAFSDGVVHAGVGSLLDLGWMYENVVSYVSDLVARKESIRKLLRDFMLKVDAFYLEKPGDDSTVCILKFKTNIKATIMVGPPQKVEDDKVVVDRLMQSEGFKIVCGGTTSQIVSREIKQKVEVEINYETPSLPPMAKIKGIDLVSEGVLTLGKTASILTDMNNAKDKLSALDLHKRDGASLLAKLLCDECTDITFLVGRAINPAHQNPDLPISLNLKLQIVKECANQLSIMGKKVDIIYY